MPSTETFIDLDYADDVTLLARMLEVLLLALDVLKDEAHPLGLDWQKTKIQSTTDVTTLPTSVLVSGNLVDSMESFIFLALKSMQLAVQNRKYAVGSAWPRPASISLTEESGFPASPPKPKLNYTMFTFNRYFSVVLKR